MDFGVDVGSEFGSDAGVELAGVDEDAAGPVDISPSSNGLRKVHPASIMAKMTIINGMMNILFIFFTPSLLFCWVRDLHSPQAPLVEVRAGLLQVLA